MGPTKGRVIKMDNLAGKVWDNPYLMLEKINKIKREAVITLLSYGKSSGTHTLNVQQKGEENERK
jgi:hypothetical protein